MRISGEDRADLRSRLAAEYVLGTLRGAARRRLEALALDERSLRDEISAWEARLTPLSDRVAAVSPPDRVWKRILRRIETPASTGDLEQKRSESLVDIGFFPRLFNSLGFWRNLGIGATGFASLLTVALFAGYSPIDREPMLTAVLEDKGVARMVIEQPDSHLLTVKMIKPWKAAPENSFQLWVLNADGSPRSIGIINQDGSTKIAAKEMALLLRDSAQFALSREPKGGSPTGQPTGAVLCKGVIAKTPAKRPKPTLATGPV